MNINKLFKIVAVLFICTAILALIFTVVALVSDSKKESGNEEKAKTISADEAPQMTSPLGTEEGIEGSSATAESEPAEKEKPLKDSSTEKTNAEKQKPAENPDEDAGGDDTGDMSDEPEKQGEAAGAEPDDTAVPADEPTVTPDGLPYGHSVPVEDLKFDGSETHFVLQNINYQVNVRKEASKDSDKVGELLKGSYGVVLEKGESFSLIKCGDLTGYILNTYLSTGRAADEQIRGTSSRKVTIDSACYVRDDANMESNKLGTAAAGVQYSFDPSAPEVHGWVAIVYEDAPKAYVSAAFCTVE